MLWRSHARPPRPIQIHSSMGLLHILFIFYLFLFIKHKVFSTNTPFSDFWCTDSRNVKLNMNFMEVQNHNQVLRFEV